MSKYNVGDVVKLRDDLEDEQEFDIIAGTFVVDEEVLELKNTSLKIVAYKKKHGFYIVEFSDGKTGRICDEMIEGLWEECKENQDKLKLIDVLNMIAKGELKVGTIVKYDEEIYTFSGENKLERELGFTLLDDIYMNNLNDEVELLEPERNVGADKTIEPTKIEELKYDVTDLDCLGIHNKTISLNIVDKLNEVINKVNAIINLLN